MKKLELELENLKELAAKMGDLAQSMVAHCVAALADPENDTHYEQVAAEEIRLDQMQLEVDKEAIRLLTVYGPVAGNLRLVLSVARINAELERIGDQTVSMCNHIHLLVSQPDHTPLAQFEGMTKLVETMLYETLKAFRLDDATKARATMANDNLVDVINDDIVRELLSGGPDRAAGNSPQGIADSVAQIMISQSLERIADQACNICEQIIYMVEGADVRHQG
ncbi:MAG: phosphate signaling complex protein PhoU [Candidatus Nealsonbacteria bacterium]|nr:phosphate signaling complex protein PhoU [Candidatus Nealsonbacteria bacterium]